ncbi:MAG: sensor histidine kinase [Vicinamibacterales bacterium]
MSNAVDAASRPTAPRPVDGSLATLVASAPWWMRWSAVALVAYSILLLTPSGRRLDGGPVELVALATRLGIEGSAFLWAAGRAALPRTLVLALRITGWASILTGVDYLASLPQYYGGQPWLSATTDSFLTLAGYAAALVALLVYPRTPARRGEGVALVLDTVVTTGSLLLLSWTLVTQVSQDRVSDPGAELWIQIFGLAQLALIAGLNVVVVRGVAVPSPRAFWWFIAGQTLYVPVTIAVQLEEARLLPPWPGDLVYYLGVLPTLAACLAFRRDPIGPSSQRGAPVWLDDLNPLPLFMPPALGATLLAALTFAPQLRAVPLAVALTVASMLLAARLLLSAHRAAVVARAESDRDRRRQAERIQAVGRLAGGIAHEFNNLMARVIGNTELGEAAPGTGDEAREHFARARAAAMRAADLTGQLLAFSGQRQVQPELVDVEANVHACYLRAARALPPGVSASLHRGDGPFAVLADPQQLDAALEQLIDNAAEAMPGGGTVTVAVARELLRHPAPMTPLAAAAGPYVVVSVTDTGTGMTPEAIAMACDPFYSTKPAHLGGGLGLASVHGFIAAHSGGLSIESAVGRGTTVRMYLPAA